MTFETLLQRQVRPLFGYVYARLRDRAAAEDVTQEAVLRACRARKECLPDQFPAWLHAIALHCCQEWERSLRRKTRALARLGREQEGSSIPSSEPDAFSDFLRSFASLAPEERLVLTLKHQAGMPCREIARHLGMPLGTVTSHLARAYERLRQEMNDE